MDDAVQAYIDGIPPEHRPLFDRIHGLVMAERPGAKVVLSYGMPAYKSGGGTLFVGAWKHGLSLYGWSDASDGGFVDRHPDLKSSKGTLKLRPETAAAIPDDDLRALVRATLPAP